MTLAECLFFRLGLNLVPQWFDGLQMTALGPRVLRDFGVELSADTEIRLWDSTAEVRYLVLPMRPLGTEGWSEERFASLVTRDCMIGTCLPRLPGEVTP